MLRNHILRRNLLKAGLLGALMMGIGSANTFAAASSEQDAPVLKTIEPGYLTVAILGELPASGIDNDRITGTDGEIISLIADKLGLKVKPVLASNAGVIEAVRSGRADVMLGNMRWTAKRADVIALSNPAYFISYGVITQKDRELPPLINISDLSGKRTGTLTGASSTAELKKIPNVAAVNFYDNSEAAIRDLTSGRLDFAVLDPTLIAFQAKRNPALNLKHVVFKPDANFAYLTGRSQVVFGTSYDNPDLLDAINAGLKWMGATGQSKKIFAKYGLDDADYFKPLDVDNRIGVDRDANGAVIGKGAHATKDFSRYFE
ncbi:substrate-binding periplasmic protein [Brenneria tiliae]|uniref:Transporter substrate-binding domain-containing protein n=1 Tax=Brenneria tiliae TaxID=2914984 RepID=A0ABT0MP88_9GAMM|nr:transporter substrate-binding domain-containing protein [Brenneria tiliae]MCL2891641.1 transporter substrate-binding domain-containing protein [Brenneria tiliae]